MREDPARGFRASRPARWWQLQLPKSDGVRVDTGVTQGSAITPYYDPMIAKMIAHAPTRAGRTGQGLHRRWTTPSRRAPIPIWRCCPRLCRADEFRARKILDTGFIERNTGDAGRRRQP